MPSAADLREKIVYGTIVRLRVALHGEEAQRRDEGKIGLNQRAWYHLRKQKPRE